MTRPLRSPRLEQAAGSRAKRRRRKRNEEIMRRKGKKGRRKRDVGEGFGEDEILGGAGELNDLVKGGGKRRKIQGGEKKIGEAWEKRVKRGIGRKRR